MSEKQRTTEELIARVQQLHQAWRDRERAKARPVPDWGGANPGNPYPRAPRGRYGNHRE